MIKFYLFTILTALLFYACSYKPVEDTGKGRKFYSNVNYDSLHQKISYYTNELTQHPEDSNILFQRSRTYRKLSEYNLALNDINDVIKNNPELKESYYERGVLYNVLNQYEDAIMDFNLLLKSDSNHINANIQIGLSYIKLNKYNISVKYLDKAILIDSLNFDAHYYRGFCYYYLANHKLSLSDFNKAIKINSNSEVVEYVYFYRGTTHWVLGNIYLALADYDKALELGIENPDILSYRKSVLEEIEDLETAEYKIEYYSNMIDSYDKNADAYYMRGLYYISSFYHKPKPNYNILEKASHDLHEYLTLDPSGKYALRAKELLDDINKKK